MTGQVPAPSPEEVRDAFTRAGANIAAAEVLGLNVRTLERQLVRNPALDAAARAGRQAHAEAKPVPEHGTRSRYARELADGVPTCDACRAENARYYAGVRAAAKARGTR